MMMELEAGLVVVIIQLAPRRGRCLTKSVAISRDQAARKVNKDPLLGEGQHPPHADRSCTQKKSLRTSTCGW